MIRITLRQMEYFEALAETHHFGRAAQLVGVTQPALSAQIAEMEARTGVRLFERHSGTVELTAAAMALQPRIERILAEARALEDDVAMSGAALEGRFRLGIIPTVAPYLLPHLLPELRRQFPRLRLEIREAKTGVLQDEALHGRLDGIVAALPFDEKMFDSAALFEDPFLLAVPTADVATVSAPVAPESVVFERLMLLEEGHCMREDALAVCGRVKPVDMASFGATSLTTLLHMVGHGLGVTLLPELAAGAAYGLPDVALIPFKEPVPTRTVALAWRKSSHRRRDQMLLAEAIRIAHGNIASGRKRTRMPEALAS